MKSKSAVIGRSPLVEKSPNLDLKQSPRVRFLLMNFLSVSGIFGADAFGSQQLALVQYIPEWLPWLSYKPLARYGYDLGQEVKHGPMSFVRESIVRTISRTSHIESSLFVRSAALLNHHLLLSVYKGQRISADENAKRLRR